MMIGIDGDLKQGDMPLKNVTTETLRRVYELALLSWAVYGDDEKFLRLDETDTVYRNRRGDIFELGAGNSAPNENQPPDWKSLCAENNCLPKSLRNTTFEDCQSGFRARLYRSKDDQRIVVAFRGTRPPSRKDWAVNIEQAFGMKTKQYQQAIELAVQLVGEYGDNITFTGHSLGGGKAAAAAIMVNGQAVTFNAAGLHPKTVKRVVGDFSTIADRWQNITNFYVKGEMLSLIQRIPFPFLKRAAGVHVELPDCGEGILAARWKHSMRFVIPVLHDEIRRRS